MFCRNIREWVCAAGSIGDRSAVSFAKSWNLDTIKQEPKLCHLYEKMGYRRTEKKNTIKEGMTLVFYEKIKETRKGWKKWGL